MGMLRDLLAVYGCVLGASLIVMGVLISAFGFVYAIIGGALYFLLVPAGIFFLAMGALVLYLILREPEPQLMAPPHLAGHGPSGVPLPGPDTLVGIDGAPWTPPPARRLELPSISVLFVLFFAGIGAGTLALYYGSIWVFLVPCLVAATMPPLIWIRYVYGQDVGEPPPPRFVRRQR